jgi:hypothetical protein
VNLICASENVWHLLMLKGIESAKNHETGFENGLRIPRFLKITVFVRCEGEGELHSESARAIRAAEYVWPLPMFKGLDSVKNHETGLERGWLIFPV